jgi:galactokinase
MIQVLDGEAIRQRLHEAGMSAGESEKKAALLCKCDAALAALGTQAANRFCWFVPGRIEFLGKHTDYAGGRSLICAVERGIAMVASPRQDDILRIVDTFDGSCVSAQIHPDVEPPAGHWANYPISVARRTARNFPGPMRGADIAFASDLPPAAGMSSSSALIVAFFSVLSAINDLPQRLEYQCNIHSPEELAGYLGTQENGQSYGTLAGDCGVGTFGGSEDHTAILCCRAGQLSQYSFCPVRFEGAIPLPENYLFAIGASGVAAHKTGQARDLYNRASLRVAAILSLWRAATSGTDATLAAAIASAPDALPRLRGILETSVNQPFSPQNLLDRLQQFVEESQKIVPAVAAALLKGEMTEIGPWIDRSQALAERLLGNQIPETIHLARLARELGAVAASAFGAGFGGSVWALVPRRGAEDFLQSWSEAYLQRFPACANTAEFFLTPAGPSLVML